MVKLTWDDTERNETLVERGLDFASAGEVFAGVRFEFPDGDVWAAGEPVVSIGFQAGRMVVVTWRAQGDERRILDMRNANEREQKRFGDRLGVIGRP